MDKETPIILAPGVSSTDWESDLQATLVKKGRLAHVFHDLEYIDPAIRPFAPIKREGQTDDQCQQLLAKYKEAAARWKQGKIEAKKCVNQTAKRRCPIPRLQTHVCKADI